jgi:hypothetical protein
VAYTITATAGANGSMSPAGAVQVLEGWNQTFAIAANTKYAISNLVVDGVNLGNRAIYTFTNVVANHTISATFTYTGRDIPQTGALLFSAITDTLPASGSTGNWSTYIPAGRTLTRMGSPTVQQFNAVKWVQNNRITSNDGFLQGQYTSPIPCSGVTIVAAVKPVYCTPGGEDRGEIVDIFYDELCLAISHPDGRIIVSRNNTWGNYSSTAIPNGQTTILSLVLQPDGSYKVYANGVQVMAVGADTGPNNGNWNTAMVPGGSGSGDAAFKHYVNVGRNNPDGWSAFNGYIGDVFVYTNALSDVNRQRLESDLTTKFINYTITASAGAGGTISPSGAVSVVPAASQTFTIAPLTGYAITNVTVDSVAQGAISSYTFTNVNANHLISATFASAPVAPPLLTISAGGGGLAITWPDSYTNQLLWSPTLGPGANWKPVGVAPDHVGSLYRFTVTPSTSNTFYGLGK